MREGQRGESCGGARVCEGRPAMSETRPIVHLLLPRREVVEVGEREVLPAVEPLAVRGELLPLHRLRLAPVEAIGADVEVVAHHALLHLQPEQVEDEAADRLVQRHACVGMGRG